ncbi:MAG: hypothetical protein JNK99_04935 [Candidatus Accumulibacter sp.]|uniref:hypothetical protein n=1 Tax=Accumulibacter sp. TaxID=2053492 RepID=UPI001A4E37EE|nr:hypothetical protein [Accumulibacter sp.]MBL8394087.1 hypothetical protein [Accumulibacter sp.]
MSPAGGRRGEIHLGELISALAGLDCDDAAQAATIAACLGFGLRAPDLAATGAATPAIYDHNRALPPPAARRSAIPHPPGLALPASSPAVEALPAQIVPSQLASVGVLPSTDSSAAPAWLVAGYQRLASERSSPPRQTLFPERAARGVLTAALARWRPGDAGADLDLDALVRCIVRRRLPQCLPRLPSMTLDNGCQLLLDYSESMVPWWEDLRELARQVSGVLGAERTSIFDFAASPAGARRWRADREAIETWQPEPGRPILVATDFGIRGEPPCDLRGSGWPAFVDRCAARDCPLLILIPWSRFFWPKNLGLHPQLVHWHPATSAALLRRQRGLGHRTAR